MNVFSLFFCQNGTAIMANSDWFHSSKSLIAMIYTFNKTTVEIIGVKMSIVTNHLIDIRTTDDNRIYLVLGNK